MTWREWRAQWLRIGRFGRENSWQPFYFWDVLLRPALGVGRYPFLRLHDAVIAPLLRNRIADSIAAILLATLFYAVFPPLVALGDRRRTTARPTLS
jgi:hypothetical protein